MPCMHHRHTATRAGGITARSISNFIMLTRRKKIEQNRQLQRLSAGKKNTFQGSVHPSDHATQQCEFCRNWLNTLDIRHYRECEPLRSQPEEYERVKRECRDTQHGRGVQPLEGIGGKDTTPSPRKARTRSRRKKVEKSVGKENKETAYEDARVAVDGGTGDARRTVDGGSGDARRTSGEGRKGQTENARRRKTGGRSQQDEDGKEHRVLSPRNRRAMPERNASVPATLARVAQVSAAHDMGPSTAVASLPVTLPKAALSPTTGKVWVKGIVDEYLETAQKEETMASEEANDEEKNSVEPRTKAWGLLSDIGNTMSMLVHAVQEMKKEVVALREKMDSCVDWEHEYAWRIFDEGAKQEQEPFILAEMVRNPDGVFLDVAGVQSFLRDYLGFSSFDECRKALAHTYFKCVDVINRRLCFSIRLEMSNRIIKEFVYESGMAERSKISDGDRAILMSKVPVKYAETAPFYRAGYQDPFGRKPFRKFLLAMKDYHLAAYSYEDFPDVVFPQSAEQKIQCIPVNFLAFYLLRVEQFLSGESTSLEEEFDGKHGAQLLRYYEIITYLEDMQAVGGSQFVGLPHPSAVLFPHHRR